MIASLQNLEWSSTPNNLRPLRFLTVSTHTWSLNLQAIEWRATLALGNLQFLGLQICQIFGSFESPGLEGHAHRYPLLNKPKYNNHVPFFDMNRWIPWNSNSVWIRATDYAFVSWLQCPCSYWVTLLTFVSFWRWESPIDSCSGCGLCTMK
jgi:hypothetical protein